MDSVLVGVLGLAIGCVAAAVIIARTRRRTAETVLSLTAQLSRAEALLQTERDKIVWIQDAQAQFKDAFKALASEELETRANQLKAAAKDELGTVVSPLRDELSKLDAHVRDLEGKQEGAYSSLGAQLSMLHGVQDNLRQQTTALAQALKAPSVRGRWGETHLRRLVELSGMQHHVDFDEQVSGLAGRPDMIIRLPQGGIVPVDAKVSLQSFMEAMETEDPDLRKTCLNKHARAMKDRIRELSQREYWDQFPISPEVVVMFVPVEPSLGAAFQDDPELFNFAFEKKVLISSPIILFALLKAIAFGWQQQQVTQNANEIAAQGRRLYERLMTFTGHLAGMGKSLESSTRKYNEAVASFEGRLLPAALRLREMGVGTSVIPSPEQIELLPRVPSADAGQIEAEDP